MRKTFISFLALLVVGQVDAPLLSGKLTPTTMAAADPRVKQIKIKTGVVKRITKEKSMYEKEIESNEARVETMKEQGKDEYEVRKQVEVLQESKAMIPDTKKRLQKAYAELDEMLKKEEDLKELEEYQQALEALENAKPAME